jgi:hypothetical protein
MSTKNHPQSRQFLYALFAVLIGVGLAACNSADNELNGRWIAEVMGDTFDCQGNLNTLMIDNNRIAVYLAGQIVQEFNGLETLVGEVAGYEGVRSIHMRSDTAQFMFSDDNGRISLLVATPQVAGSVLDRLPQELRRCP